jgi:hypothetical protein
MVPAQLMDFAWSRTETSCRSFRPLHQARGLINERSLADPGNRLVLDLHRIDREHGRRGALGLGPGGGHRAGFDKIRDGLRAQRYDVLAEEGRHVAEDIELGLQLEFEVLDLIKVVQDFPDIVGLLASCGY